MSRLSQRLSRQDSEQSPHSDPLPLSPIVERFLAALEFIASENPGFRRVAQGFAKHIRRNPMDEAELFAALKWTEEMIRQVIGDYVPPTEGGESDVTATESGAHFSTSAGANTGEGFTPAEADTEKASA